MPNLRLLPAGVDLTAHEGEPILATIVRDGFKYRVGCRRGGCGICKADLLSGQVDYPVRVADSVLTEQEQAAGTVLTCRAVPRTDVVVQFPAESRLRMVVPLAFGLATTQWTAKITSSSTASNSEEPPRSERHSHVG